MPAVTIRNLPEETHRALKKRAELHGRSTEAEIRDILERAVLAPDHIKLGSVLLALGQNFGGVDLDHGRDLRGADPIEFE